MIWFRNQYNIRINIAQDWPTHLVVNVGNVHHKVDIVSKIVPQNPTNDILRQVVPIPSVLVRFFPSVSIQIYHLRRTWHDPYDSNRILSVHNYTNPPFSR